LAGIKRFFPIAQFAVLAGLLKQMSDNQCIRLANFCGCGLVASENWLIKSLNHDTRPILFSIFFLFLFSNFNIFIFQYFHKYTTADHKTILAGFFLHLINEDKYYEVRMK